MPGCAPVSRPGPTAPLAHDPSAAWLVGDLIAALDERRARPTADVLRAILARIVDGVPGGLAASICWPRGDAGERLTGASTSSEAALVERVSHRTAPGPCRAVAQSGTIALDADGLRDGFPVLAEELLATTDARALLAVPLPGTRAAAVTVTASERFDAGSVARVEEHAPLLAVAVAALLERERCANLEVALSSSRQIAAATGIVMAQYRCSYDEAFERIRSASQRAHRKIRDLAEDIVLTGALSERAASSLARDEENEWTPRH